MPPYSADARLYLDPHSYTSNAPSTGVEPASVPTLNPSPFPPFSPPLLYSSLPSFFPFLFPCYLSFSFSSFSRFTSLTLFRLYLSFHILQVLYSHLFPSLLSFPLHNSCISRIYQPSSTNISTSLRHTLLQPSSVLSKHRPLAKTATRKDGHSPRRPLAKTLSEASLQHL